MGAGRAEFAGMTVIYLSERIRREERKSRYPRYHDFVNVPPEHVLRERDACLYQPQTLTAELMGDPLPGRSALDRR